MTINQPGLTSSSLIILFGNGFRSLRCHESLHPCETTLTCWSFHNLSKASYPPLNTDVFLVVNSTPPSRCLFPYLQIQHRTHRFKGQRSLPQALALSSKCPLLFVEKHLSSRGVFIEYMKVVVSFWLSDCRHCCNTVTRWIRIIKLFEGKSATFKIVKEWRFEGLEGLIDCPGCDLER